MQRISLNTACILTGRSKRTLWRRIAEGVLHTVDAQRPGERAQLLLDEVLPLACIPIQGEDIELLLAADAGDAQAQCDLALLFLLAGKREGALYWLDLSAHQGYGEAMYRLARCHIAGDGVPQDENAGIGWLARAAGRGHAVAQRQIAALQEGDSAHAVRSVRRSGSLDAFLEAIEVQMVYEALLETAYPPASIH